MFFKHCFFGGINPNTVWGSNGMYMFLNNQCQASLAISVDLPGHWAFVAAKWYCMVAVPGNMVGDC